MSGYLDSVIELYAFEDIFVSMFKIYVIYVLTHLYFRFKSICCGYLRSVCFMYSQAEELTYYQVLNPVLNGPLIQLILNGEG